MGMVRRNHFLFDAMERESGTGSLICRFPAFVSKINKPEIILPDIFVKEAKMRKARLRLKPRQMRERD